MIYKLNNKYYIKVSGYLIEVIPVLTDGVLDFKTTQNKIEITQNLLYKSVSNDEIKNELEVKETNEEFEIKPKKVPERTHSKFKFNMRD